MGLGWGRENRTEQNVNSSQRGPITETQQERTQTKKNKVTVALEMLINTLSKVHTIR